MRRRLHTYAVQLEPRAEDPHPRAHDKVVHIRRLLYREAIPAVACL